MRTGGGRRLSRRALLLGAAGGALVVTGCTAGSGTDDPGRPTVPGPSNPTAPPQEDRASATTYVGYVPYWDQAAGFGTVNRHPAVFDQISPMWYSLDRTGGIVPADDEYARADPAAVAAMQARGTKVLPTITNLRNGDWAPNLVQSMLEDDAVMTAHVAAIRELVATSGYDGIDVDYEDLSADDRNRYSAFLVRLADAMHADGKLITSSVYAKDAEPGPNPHNQAQDYALIGAVCDQLRVMTFDYHYSDGDPGPIAPVDWVERMISWSVTQVPARKVMLGVVLLGNDWPADGTGTTVSHQQATALATETGSTIEYLDGDDSPHFSYTDDDGVDHQVWFEDAGSSARKLGLVERYGLGGATFWRLGGEDPQTWAIEQLSTHGS